jgi:hypothetical protein
VSADNRLSVAIVGAGPTGTGFLERFSASALTLLPGVAVHVHLIDPFPPGSGRVWRHDQSPLLRMNSMAADVTMFTDDSVTCAGPIRPGPSLIEWAALVAGEGLGDDDLTAEVRQLGGTTFPTRRLQSAYLAWVYDRVIDELPPCITVTVHRARATGLSDGPDGRQVVALTSGEDPIVVDIVVLALGHLDREPIDGEAQLATFAQRWDLYYLPPAYTADADLSGIAPDSTVVLRGLGLAFIDLMVLLTEGRGGRFVSHLDGTLGYLPSGLEPHLVAGSRRGVPYHAKLTYALQGAPPQLPMFLDNATIGSLLATGARLDFRADVWPLLAKEISWGYYHELFTGHPERTNRPWPDFASDLAELDWGGPEYAALVAGSVPAEDDRLDFDRLDRPLRGVSFESAGDLQDRLRGYVSDDLARRSDPYFSADLGAFGALLTSFGQLSRVLASGQLAPRSRIEDFDGWWFGFFSFLASGPPAHRLRELLALSEAGIVEFLGADMWVEADEAEGRWRAGSASSPHIVEAGALIEARLPRPSVGHTRDDLLRSLHAAGDGIEDELIDPADDSRHRTGRLKVAGDTLELLDQAGRAHPRRFAVGVHTSQPAAGAFARPGRNALSFRQNDVAARAVLSRLADLTPRCPPRSLP